MGLSEPRALGQQPCMLQVPRSHQYVLYSKALRASLSLLRTQHKLYQTSCDQGKPAVAVLLQTK
jgi:hypothetical protein